MPVFSRKTVILDLGASRTALGVFSRSNGRLRLDNFAVKTFPGLASGEADWLEQTRAALAVLRTRASTGRPVVLVLPPHLALTKLIKTPRVEPAKRAKVLRFEAEQSIPYALTEVVWDTVVASDHGSEIELLLTAAKRETIETLCALVQTEGFEPQLILPSSLATLAAFRLVQGAPMEPALVLNVGARSTTLLQVTDQRFTVRSLALGTRSIMWKTAEEQDHVALEIIATRLAQEIMRSVLHFRRQGVLETAARVWLAGGGARLNGLAEALAAKLKVPVDQVDLSGIIELGRGVAHNDAAGQALTLADLVGAAATQMRTGQPVLNLLPPARRQQANRRRRLWLATASLVTAAALWFLVGYLRPAAGSARAAVVIRTEAAPRVSEISAAPLAAPPSDEAEAFDLELLGVETASFPLQFAGYFGEPDDYLLAFTGADQSETLLVRRGHRFEQLGLTLRSFELRKVAVDHADAWPVYEVAAFAELHEEKTGATVVLESRRKPTVTLRAVLRGTPDRQTSTLQEGEVIAYGSATYRIQRIQADPPEVVVVRQAQGPSLPEARVLRPAGPPADSGVQSAETQTASSPNSL